MYFIFCEKGKAEAVCSFQILKPIKVCIYKNSHMLKTKNTVSEKYDFFRYCASFCLVKGRIVLKRENVCRVFTSISEKNRLIYWQIFSRFRTIQNNASLRNHCSFQYVKFGTTSKLQQYNTILLPKVGRQPGWGCSFRHDV